MARIVSASEVQHENTVETARWLLGKHLVVQPGSNSVRIAGRIVEAEAYHSQADLACHASRGRTRRTEVLFAAGGVWYVYLIYGMHEMLNLVTGPRDFPAAVLIRGVEHLIGPGRLTRALGIDRRFNARPAHPETGLWIEDDGFVPPEDEVLVTPRIGIDYAGPIWAARPWRFVWQFPPKPARETPAVPMKRVR